MYIKAWWMYIVAPIHQVIETQCNWVITVWCIRGTILSTRIAMSHSLIKIRLNWMISTWHNLIWYVVVIKWHEMIKIQFDLMIIVWHKLIKMQLKLVIIAWHDLIKIQIVDLMGHNTYREQSRRKRRNQTRFTFYRVWSCREVKSFSPCCKLQQED